MNKCSKKLYSNSNLRVFLGLTVVHKYQGEGAILSRKCYAWEDCPGDSTSLNTDNVDVFTRSCPYQPETLGPWGKSFVFALFMAQGFSHHLMRQALSQKEGERGEYVCVYAYLHV